MRFIFLTMDGNHGAALRQAAELLRREHAVDVDIHLYNATSLRSDEDWRRLEQDAAGADIGVADLGIAHLALGQADIGAKGHQRRIRAVAHQPVEIRRLRLRGGALFGAVGNAPSVEDAKDDWLRVGHGLSLIHI